MKRMQSINRQSTSAKRKSPKCKPPNPSQQTSAPKRGPTHAPHLSASLLPSEKNPSGTTARLTSQDQPITLIRNLGFNFGFRFFFTFFPARGHRELRLRLCLFFFCSPFA